MSQEEVLAPEARQSVVLGSVPAVDQVVDRLLAEEPGQGSPEGPDQDPEVELWRLR